MKCNSAHLTLLLIISKRCTSSLNLRINNSNTAKKVGAVGAAVITGRGVAAKVGIAANKGTGLVLRQWAKTSTKDAAAHGAVGGMIGGATYRFTTPPEDFDIREFSNYVTGGAVTGSVSSFRPKIRDKVVINTVGAGATQAIAGDSVDIPAAVANGVGGGLFRNKGIGGDIAQSTFTALTGARDKQPGSYITIVTDIDKRATPLKPPTNNINLDFPTRRSTIESWEINPDEE